MIPDSLATLVVLLGPAVGLVLAAKYLRDVRSVSIHDVEVEDSGVADEAQRTPRLGDDGREDDSLMGGHERRDSSSAPAPAPPAHGAFVMTVEEISEAISLGADSFLKTELLAMGAFLLAFGLVLFVVLGSSDDSSWHAAGLTFFSFLVGSCTSAACGYIGMKVAVFSNSRTAVEAQSGIGSGFTLAFKSGSAVGFLLTSTGVLALFFVVSVYRRAFPDSFGADREATVEMFEAVAGFGLGGSCVALFGRVGGGIYTKAADVGADLVGKVEQGIPEDDPRNPAVIADNVGDNVGDVAGMSADLFGSFAESSCASMVLASQAQGLHDHWSAMVFPMAIIATGIAVSVLTAQFATRWQPVTAKDEVEVVLKRQLLLSTVIMTPVLFIVSVSFLPDSFTAPDVDGHVRNWQCFVCVASGLWAGLVIGYITEYFTSFSYSPVREVASSCQTGAATNIIYGLALGYKSTIVPAAMMSGTIYVSFSLAGMYGISLAALGILSTMATGLGVDVFGPVADNAGGIAEMAHMPSHVRDTTDCLDAAGNTTAAIGKGFAIGSAAFVSLALFGAFVTVADLDNVNILSPLAFAGLMMGAELPYWFSAMTMKAVGSAALAMVEEVRRQFAENPRIMEGTMKPDYARCVAISTEASIRKMVAPAVLVIFSPLVVGFLFGTEMLAGLLAGALVSGVQMAISSSNTGGAWDNAKKYIEAGHFGGKGSDQHKAAVIGDTVGDPLKDTSGPALNILIKLMAIISLVFARSLPEEGVLFRIF